MRPGFWCAITLAHLARRPMSFTAFVRFGAIPEVGRFFCAPTVHPERGQSVVVESHRGLELGTLLEYVRTAPGSGASSNAGASSPTDTWQVLRVSTPDDRATHERLRQDAASDYAAWQKRILQWGIALELIDVEWTLDRQKLILYVLGERGSDTTRLALQAAAEGQTVIEVQPVAADGVVAMPAGGGGGCGSGGCGCHH